MSISILNFSTAILHVASQKANRWIRPPDPAVFAACLNTGICSLWDDGPLPEPASASRSDWGEVVNRLVPAMPEIFPQKIAADLDGLIRACHDFFVALRSAGAAYIPFWSEGYPGLLRQISDPPMGLSIAGDGTLLLRPSIAVVGSRFAANWAVEWANDFGKLSSAADIPVVSGGAYGCDAAVHNGMLAARFDAVPAIAVFAGGLGCPYPRHNIRLFEDIAASGGCLVSERSLDARCRPHDFLARNRIISGLSLGTIIVQAAERSGAMVTARCAADQSRDVWVVRPPFPDIRAAGNQCLLDDGAMGLGRPVDAMVELAASLMTS